MYRTIPNSSKFHILALGAFKYSSKGAISTKRVQEDLRKFHGETAPVLVIANAETTQQARRLMAASDLKVIWQKWRSEADTPELQEKMTALLQ
ncbi:hypothetical protein ACFCWG_45660 [Streptomyces sp. NPDC056390]|uniref:hypothetical protein n=1 Tax=Streptomyces sp. NPDC056390 TaxID=3345806 RepID=UPI0035D939FC